MRLRHVIPGILLLTGTANMLLRLLPPDRIALRSWEAVTLFVTSTGPFAPRKQYFNPAAPGDLGTLANLPQYRRPHLETFTTGPHGYRVYEPDAWPPPAAVLFGDSFGAGASLTDTDALCSRLTAVFGGPVFFAAYYSPDAVAKLDELPKASYVILQLSERYSLNDAAPGQGESAAAIVKKLVRNSSPLYRGLRYVYGLLAYSPMEIWAGRAYRYLQNDSILPNVYARNVACYSLRNHSEMLFLNSEVSNYYAPPLVTTDTLASVRNQIESRGFQVIVLLVPNKFTVYYPLLQKVAPGPAEDRLYINVLERKLRYLSIPVVNLTRALRERAADALAKDELIYHLDDTHWNAEGVRVAAEEVRRTLHTEPLRAKPKPIQKASNPVPNHAAH